MIPTVSKILTGDKTKASEYLGIANRQLNILVRQMELSIPKPLETDQHNFKLESGGYIIVSACYNARTIRIHIPTGEERKLEIERFRKCICNCNFTTGKVIEKQSNVIGLASLYTVKACKDKDHYVIYENVLASDYTDYADYQTVIMIPYNEAAFQCCISTTQDVTGCKPLESELDIESNAWRSALRIVPWCATKIPQWIDLRKVTNG